MVAKRKRKPMERWEIEPTTESTRKEELLRESPSLIADIIVEDFRPFSPRGRWSKDPRSVEAAKKILETADTGKSVLVKTVDAELLDYFAMYARTQVKKKGKFRLRGASAGNGYMRFYVERMEPSHG